MTRFERLRLVIHNQIYKIFNNEKEKIVKFRLQTKYFF